MTAHSRRLARFGLLIGVAALLAADVSNGRADTRREREQAAVKAVHEALQAEARGYGDRERQRLLDAAKEQFAEFAPAMWHTGHVKITGDWLTLDEAAEHAAGDRRLVAYERMREEALDTPDDQLELAEWCLKRGLDAQARAHLTRVLEHAPDHPAARQKLGFQNVDGAWLSAAEIQQSAQQARELAQDLRKWQPKLARILAGLKHRAAVRQQKADEDLFAIDDPAAVPAMELALSLETEIIARKLVQALAAIPADSASTALARQAVFSPWESIRRTAAAELKSREKVAFVPALLSSLFGRVQSRAELYGGPGGRLMYRHVFYREGQEHRQLAVMETAYKRIALAGGDGLGTLNRALHDIHNQYLAREQAAAMQNAITQEMNERICQVLTTVTGELNSSDPDAWWQWWNDYNEVFAPGEKPVDEKVHVEQVTLVDEVSGGSSDSSSGGHSPPPSPPMDCLARGTIVWTITGEKAIEEVEIGDLVLSQDPETGELAYKPVLRTTLRPPSDLIKMKVGDYYITTSGGHLFWASGQGWTKSRALDEGQDLHCVRGTARVQSVEKAGFEETFNLVVADFNTYFVGPQKVLSHDNTIRRATDAVVPGYKE